MTDQPSCDCPNCDEDFMSHENRKSALPENKSLHTRIAAAIKSIGTVDQCCAELAAKAVIRELALQEEHVELLTRYVTKWQQQ